MMTPGCTAEGRGLRDQYEGFKRKGVEVLVSRSTSLLVNAAFVARSLSFWAALRSQATRLSPVQQDARATGRAAPRTSSARTAKC
jgi:hypothetical protein